MIKATPVVSGKLGVASPLYAKSSVKLFCSHGKAMKNALAPLSGFIAFFERACASG
jgi:hypothetical protein